ncbi:MAG TPA: TonB-dependent receptor [Blastocatellia bacterium]|nr:TonB-dependent receptor [Blastocatellia bacterium]
MRKPILVIFFIVCSALFPLFVLSAQDRQATLHGRVVDAVTGEPVAKVKIIVSGTQQNTSTDERGGFTLGGLQPGEVELYITAVGYGFVKKSLILKEGENTEKEIALNQEAATLTEQITVTADPYEKTETNAASEQNMSKLELQTLTMVIVGDPLRAAQALPGVVANNDLRSDFAVRGAGFDRIAVYIDGIISDSFVHRLTESSTTDELSLSIINQETVSELSLFGGAYPVKYGASSAGALKLETRAGNRVRPSGRIATGVLTTSAVVDGPLQAGRGSWLVAARTSYIDYLQRLVERVTGTGRSQTDQDEDGNLDFSDMQGKAIYDLSPHHRLGVSAIFGIFRGGQGDENRAVNQGDLNVIDKTDSRNLFVNAHWNYNAGSRLLADARAFLLRTDYKTTNVDDLTLDERERTQFGLRGDASFLAFGSQNIEAGLYVRSIHARKLTNFLRASQPLAPLSLEAFNRSATEQAYYAQDTLGIERARLTLTAGVRLDHSGLTGETLFSPRASLSLAAGENLRIRAGVGRYYQFADFDKLFGFSGNPTLGAESATHYNVSLERSLGSRTRLLAEVYDREDRDLIFSLSEPRVEAGRITIEAEPFSNSLRGYARGIELSLQRRSANGLTGWLSYAYSKTLLTDRLSNLSFVSDFDQRHTVNLFGSYRFTETLNLMGQWRYGSGLPWIGFLREEGSLILLGSERNRVRAPAYSRVDVRANKAFLFKKWKLTLSGEVLNLLHHMNEYNVESNLIRFRASGIFITGLRESFRILPSVGVAIEF